MKKTDGKDSRVGTGRGSGVRHYHSIYDPAELARAIRQLKGSGVSTNDGVIEQPDDAGGWSFVAEPATLTADDANRLRVLERLAADPRGHRRCSILGTPGMVSRIEALSATLPHFAPVIELVARAALVSARTSTPLRLPPLLLLGAPGIGKSYALRLVADAIGAAFAHVAANMTDSFRLKGMNTAWRGARMGRVAEILFEASTAPIILVDEFDKAVGDRIERPYDIWHSLLERENACRFRDDFLEVDLRADQTIWIASANDISVLPHSIQDRLLVLEIPSPNREQLGTIVASIYSDCRAALGGLLPEHLDDDVLQELSRHNPRRIGRLIDLAVGYAAAGGRRRLCVEDVRCAHQLAGDGRNTTGGFREPVGFTGSQNPDRR